MQALIAQVRRRKERPMRLQEALDLVLVRRLRGKQVSKALSNCRIEVCSANRSLSSGGHLG